LEKAAYEQLAPNEKAEKMLKELINKRENYTLNIVSIDSDLPEIITRYSELNTSTLQTSLATSRTKPVTTNPYFISVVFTRNLLENKALCMPLLVAFRLANLILLLETDRKIGKELVLTNSVYMQPAVCANVSNMFDLGNVLRIHKSQHALLQSQNANPGTGPSSSIGGSPSIPGSPVLPPQSGPRAQAYQPPSLMVTKDMSSKHMNIPGYHFLILSPGVSVNVIYIDPVLGLVQVNHNAQVGYIPLECTNYDDYLNSVRNRGGSGGYSTGEGNQGRW